MSLLVRFVLSPSLLSPFILVLIPLLGLYTGASVLALVMGLVIDLVVVAAEQLRLQRGHIEAAALYAQLGLGWVCRRYARWLLHALQSTEKLLYGVGAVLAPLGIKLAQRVPLLAWVLAPFLYLSSAIYSLVEDAYAFVHDEIVPVALDLAERFPLVEEMLLRHAYSDNRFGKED